MPEPPTGAPLIAPALPNGTRYNEVRQKSAHNAFANEEESICEQIVLSNVHSLEVDLHKGDDGDWSIYHADPRFLEPYSNVESFMQFLKWCKTLHQWNTAHEAITVFLDMHDDFEDDGNHTANRLDALIGQYLPDSVYTPGELLGSHPTLQTAAREKNWEPVNGLKGHFIFVMTNASHEDFFDNATRLHNYIDRGNLVKMRKAFIAPEINSADQIGNYDYAVFFNFKWDDNKLSDTLFQGD
jgi:hypothetical protein